MDDEDELDYILNIIKSEIAEVADDEDELVGLVHDDVDEPEYNGRGHNDETQDDAQTQDDDEDDELEALEELEDVMCDDIDDCE